MKRKKFLCFHLETEIKGNYLYLILIRIQDIIFFHLFVHPTNIDLALVWAGSAPHRPLSTKGWPTVVACLQPLKFCLLARCKWKITSSFDLWTGTPEGNGIELWRELFFSISLDRHWDKMRVDQCVHGWERGEGRKERREENIYCLCQHRKSVTKISFKIRVKPWELPLKLNRKKIKRCLLF